MTSRRERGVHAIILAASLAGAALASVALDHLDALHARAERLRAVDASVPALRLGRSHCDAGR